MNGINGLEIRVGCVVKSDDGYFRRVDWVDDEGFRDSHFSSSIEEALKQKRIGNYWEAREIKPFGIHVVQYAPLGVFDEKGREWHDQDTLIDFVGSRLRVFHAIRNSGADGKDYIFYFINNVGSWSLRPSNEISIHSRPTDPGFNMPKTIVTFETRVNGELTKEPLSIETARRLGIVK